MRSGWRFAGSGFAWPIPPMLVSHICYDRTFADLVRHELRAARTIRNIDPLGYVGLVATNPTPFALAAAALGASTSPACALLLLALASRMAVSIQAGRLLARAGARRIWLGPFRDLLSFAIFVASFLPGSLVWRGRRFELRSDGTLEAKLRDGSRMRTLFLQAPSYDGFDGGAGARYQMRNARSARSGIRPGSPSRPRSFPTRSWSTRRRTG